MAYEGPIKISEGLALRVDLVSSGEWHGPLTELGQELFDDGDIKVFQDREVANATARKAERIGAGVIYVSDGKIEVE